MAKCRARNTTPPYNLCRHDVKAAGDRCFDHKGMPAAGPRPSKSSSNPQRNSKVRRASQSSPQQSLYQLAPTKPKSVRQPASSRPPQRSDLERLWDEHKKVREAAAMVAVEISLDGWQATVTSELTERLSPSLLRVTTRRWRRRNCRALAALARRILRAKAGLHDVLANWIFRLWEWLGRPRFEQLLARELGKRIPVPIVDDYAAAIARSLQIVGIAMCVHSGRNLTSCACFKDVVLEEGQEMVGRLMRFTLKDWSRLNQLPA
jgi:hypothetical protein